jgi:hypothetical protein
MHTDLIPTAMNTLRLLMLFSLSLSRFSTLMQQLRIRIIRDFHARSISQARILAATNFYNAFHAATSVQFLPVLVLPCQLLLL